VSEDLLGELPAEAVELYLQAVETGSIPMDPSPAAPDTQAPAAPDYRQRLLDLGLLKPGVERPVLVPVDPETAAAQQERRAANQLARAAELRDRWQALTTAYRAERAWHDETSLVRYVAGKEAVGQQLQLVLSGPVKRLRTIQPGGPRPAELIRATIAEELDMARRGIQRQMLYQDSQRHHAPSAQFVRTVTEAGAEVRTLPHLPDRVFLIDDLVMYPLDGDTEIAVFNREPSMVAFISRLFEQNWERAAPFEERPEIARGKQLSAEQRRIIRLLVGGMTTEAIGSALAMSLRTVNRHLEKTRKIFDADSLAELAYKIRGEYPDGLPAEW
jgi:DNA-binding CsgD family transcriptional regulator